MLDLLLLDCQVANTKAQSIKNSTKKNLMIYLNSYKLFCDRFGFDLFPCDNKQLCRFGQYLARTFKSAEAVGNYQSGVRTCHALLGLEIPDPSEKQMQMFTQGLKRILLHAVKQAEPMTPELLLRISKVVNYKDDVELVAWVAVLLGFYMFMRCSNLVPDTMDDYNVNQQFCRVDLNITSSESVMMVEVRWSKTVQFRQKILRYPVLPAQNKVVCPVYWTFHMINRIPAEPKDPAFMVYIKGQKLALSANQLIYRLRKWLILLGNVEPEVYSLHSLRRGGATFAYQCNIESEMIHTLGSWASDAYKCYIDVTKDQRYDSMKAFVEGLNQMCIESH